MLPCRWTYPTILVMLVCIAIAPFCTVFSSSISPVCIHFPLPHYNSSVSRPVMWEPPPSSLCSWELFPKSSLSRLNRFSLSAGALTQLLPQQQSDNKATQTINGDEEEEESGPRQGEVEDDATRADDSLTLNRKGALAGVDDHDDDVGDQRSSPPDSSTDMGMVSHTVQPPFVSITRWP